MHRHSIRLAVMATAIAGSAAAQQPLKEMARPCVAIREACGQAGFVMQGARAGEGLIIDCIRPIMLGRPQPRRATRPLPAIDPQIVAACRTRNPQFSFGNGPERQPAGAPGEAGPMPWPMRPGQPQAPAAVTPHARVQLGQRISHGRTSADAGQEDRL